MMLPAVGNGVSEPDPPPPPFLNHPPPVPPQVLGKQIIITAADYQDRWCEVRYYACSGTMV